MFSLVFSFCGFLCFLWLISTLSDGDGQAAARGFFVFGEHVAAGFAHGLDDTVEGDAVFAVAS